MQQSIHNKPPAWCADDVTQSQLFVLTLCGEVSVASHIVASKQLIESNGSAVVLDQALSAEYAHDLTFETTAVIAWEMFQILAQKFADVDIAIQPVSQRRKRLLICDMDETIVDIETLDAVAESVGIGSQVASITDQAMRGEIDFSTALKQRVDLLKGQPEQIFIDISNRCGLNPGAETLLQQARQAGIYTVLISGGFDTIAKPVAARLGFDEVHSNRLEVRDGYLTGQVIEPIIDANSKHALLLSLAKKRNIALSQCCTIGDGANDIPMLRAAGLGIAYHGKPATRLATPYQINRTNLNTAVYFMGLLSA